MVIEAGGRVTDYKRQAVFFRQAKKFLLLTG